MRVLLHTCCGPCFINPLKILQKEGHQVIVFFYNPNIHPYQEYEKRLECLKNYAEPEELEMIEGSYDVEHFFQEVVFQNKVRCSRCYRLRLAESASLAKKEGFEAFSTTLLGSPHQDIKLIAELGKVIGERNGLVFLNRNFRSGWQEGVRGSKVLGMYRQNYCGCSFSLSDKTLPHRTVKSPTSAPSSVRLRRTAEGGQGFGGQGKVESKRKIR